MKKIILASTSPRRKEIFEKLRIPFEIEASSYEEDMSVEMEPEVLAKHLSKGKALEVAKRHAEGIIIGADTFIVFDGGVIGKPSNAVDARNTLKRFSGKTISVITGITMIDAATNNIFSRAVVSKLTFRELSEEEIEGYIDSGEPLDKAGSIGVHGLGAALIEKIDGDFFNLMGLPIKDVVDGLSEFGINIWRRERWEK